MLLSIIRYTATTQHISTDQQQQKSMTISKLFRDISLLLDLYHYDHSITMISMNVSLNLKLLGTIEDLLNRCF